MSVTLLDVLDEHAAHRGSATAYRYLEDGDHESATLTFADTIAAAKRIAARLHANGLSRRCVLLAIRHELSFLQALLGCFYAGAIAVPVAIPRRDSEATMLKAIAANADARALLLSRHDEKFHGMLLRSIERLTMHYCEDALQDYAHIDHTHIYESATGPERVQPSDLAFLQYTSGSTGAPKGVKVSHANLLANERAIQQAMRLDERTVFVSWLPLFHDMGLVGSALQPLFLGVSCVLMPPHAFLMKPIRWLEAISRYGGTTSGAPNFAYNLCVEKVTDAQRATLDLRSWTVAFNGSEPVRAETLDRFAAAFAGAGFKRSSFYPCYGMAESTLIVSGPIPQTEPVTLRVLPESLQLGSKIAEADHAASIVACGRPVLGTTIRIVDPNTHTTLPADYVGEIWIQGDSVTTGYCGAPEKTAAAFAQDSEASVYLRTGDLGCIHDGLLFVLGRLKDIVIIRGRKYYPQDLEAVAAASNPHVAAGGAAALAIEPRIGEVGESLAIVQELTRSGWRVAEPSQVRADIREALVREYGIAPAVIALIKPGALPRTTSGKIRRAHCREMLLANVFEQLHERNEAEPSSAGAQAEEVAS